MLTLSTNLFNIAKCNGVKYHNDSGGAFRHTEESKEEETLRVNARRAREEKRRTDNHRIRLMRCLRGRKYPFRKVLLLEAALL